MSNDWHHLLAFLQEHRHRPLALATLVAREGSSYRQPGARLLVAPGGPSVGSLSGGCLEEGIAQVAQRVLADGQARTERIDTRPHFGCPGKLTILIEKLPPGGLREAITTRIANRETFTLSTNATETRLGAPESAHDFVETVHPRPRLLVVGWTADENPLFEMAQILHWECYRLLKSPRQQVAQVAHEFATFCPAEELEERFPPDSATALLVMSHHLATDLAFLNAAIPANYSYLGLLGSKRRREELLAELGARGLLEDPTWVERFYAPVGLDLGADNPATIALAILAEIQAVFAHRQGGFLRERLGSIHGQGQRKALESLTQ
ncbi:XdhC family protein [Roseibacillus ishigakijimensis]|uniref:XdhC family protein n=1 Tax=Roseibacillus ishigakijimensis TaxID=454146 RepID=A0A934RTC1_9BACT|nr:XdhC family protein [Roseibacillus ishigakijimensis]MBK1833805.1 XdhC family protein [Roseibacillus ishigakijimensis]